MPKAAPRPCTHPGCGRLVAFGEVCPQHPVKAGTFSDRRRGSRQSRGYDSAWERARKDVIKRDGGLCQPCLRAEPSVVTRFHAVDHIVSKAEAKRLGWARDETDAASNLQCICRTCHTAKTAQEARLARSGGSLLPSQGG